LGLGAAFFLSIGAARLATFFATSFLAVFRATAFFFEAAVRFLADDILLAAEGFFRPTDAFFRPADAIFRAEDRLRPALRRVVTAFRRAFFRLAAFPLAISTSFLRPKRAQPTLTVVR
jgi:hypothetical protein